MKKPSLPAGKKSAKSKSLAKKELPLTKKDIEKVVGGFAASGGKTKWYDFSDVNKP